MNTQFECDLVSNCSICDWIEFKLQKLFKIPQLRFHTPQKESLESIKNPPVWGEVITIIKNKQKLQEKDTRLQCAMRFKNLDWTDENVS